MNNIKYYNDSLAYDFEMFMPKTADTEKRRDNIVAMPKVTRNERAFFSSELPSKFITSCNCPCTVATRDVSSAVICMTVRTGYVLWRSAASSAPRRTKRRERSSGQERRSERAAKSNVKIKASENGEKVFYSVQLSARNRALSNSERRLPFRMMFRRFTQRHIKRQKRKVLPVTNVSLAVFPAESRASKTSALWRIGVTI